MNQRVRWAIVTRVQPRTFRGITDLLLAPGSAYLEAYAHPRRSRAPTGGGGGRRVGTGVPQHQPPPPPPASPIPGLSRTRPRRGRGPPFPPKGVGRSTPPDSGSDSYTARPRTIWKAEIMFVIGISQTNHSTNQERPCTTLQRIEKELSICQSSLRSDLVRFPVLSQIKPHIPRLVVSFRQFL